MFENDNENDNLQKFITDIKNNIPVFYAVRFFTIDRKTIFGIFNAIVTFLIVMIQFEMSNISSSDEKCCYNNTCSE